MVIMNYFEYQFEKTEKSKKLKSQLSCKGYDPYNRDNMKTNQMVIDSNTGRFKRLQERHIRTDDISHWFKK
jgi:hypothetical protein